MAEVKQLTTRVAEDGEKLIAIGPGWLENGGATLENNLAFPRNVKHTSQQLALLSTYPRELEADVSGKVWAQMLTS